MTCTPIHVASWQFAPVSNVRRGSKYRHHDDARGYETCFTNDGGVCANWHMCNDCAMTYHADLRTGPREGGSLRVRCVMSSKYRNGDDAIRWLPAAGQCHRPGAEFSSCAEPRSPCSVPLLGKVAQAQRCSVASCSLSLRLAVALQMRYSPPFVQPFTLRACSQGNPATRSTPFHVC